MGFEAGSGWSVTLLGWPAVAGAAVAFIVAAIRKSRGAAIVGCVLAAPMFLYVSLAPRFGWIGVTSLALLCVLAWRVRRSHLLVTCVLALPAAVLLAWLAYVVLSSR